MAKVKKNSLVSGLSGSLGPNHYARVTKDGSTIISTKPDFSNRQFSQDQLSHQDRVKLAAAYGKVASKENPIYAKKAEGTDKNAYNIAFKDWFHPPVLHGIQCQNGRLRVAVTDDVMVSQVTVTILDPQGNPLERGEAELVNSVYWDFQPMNRGSILVEAWDLPGNVAQYEFCPPPGNQYFWEQKVESR